MSEKEMRQEVRKALKRLDAKSIENCVGVGTPDVNYADGWLELKWEAHWPVRPETPLRIDHYTPVQRLWHMKRWTAGGRVYLLLQVASDWLLFNGDTAATIVGRVPRAELVAHAVAHWVGNQQMKAELPRFLSLPRAT